MSVLSLFYWKSDVCWRQNNKHFAELAPQNGGKQLIWTNYVTVTISSTCFHSTLNFGPLAAEIGWWVWVIQANFNGFRVLGSLLHRRRWTKVNQTLHGVWLSPGLVHCIYIFGASCPLTEFYKVQYSLCVHVLRSPILAALLHVTRAVGVKLCGVQ